MIAPALEIRQLTKRFDQLIAVNRVDLVVPQNRVVALVGESGSGKTTTGLMALRLIEPTAGQILLGGDDITDLSQKELKPFRRQMQVVFQDSYSSLDPMMTLGEIIAEPLAHPRHRHARRTARPGPRTGSNASASMAAIATRYPHELSGGQRQRVSVARALILGASVLVADEPTSALDVSVKAQIVNLLQDLQADMGLSILFISHDLERRPLAHRQVVVMYRGRVVEQRADRHASSPMPRHPYTRALLDAIPVINPQGAPPPHLPDRRGDRPPARRGSAPLEIETPAVLDTAEPQLVALAGSHFVEAIVTG